MRTLLRTLLSVIVSPTQRKRLKRIEHKLKKRLAHMGPALGYDDMRHILTNDLGLSHGETVMVHAGLSLVNTHLTPQDIIDLIRDLIGPDGTLVAPTFSPISAIDYMQQPEPFDVQNSCSGMGAFAETLRKMPLAVRSLHPTKSLAMVGRDVQMLCAGHENCLYPFGVGSPFEKLHARNARIIGIGVPMSYLSFVHVAEDMFPNKVKERVWHPQIFEKLCVDAQGQAQTVSTYVHDMSTMVRANPAKFCQRHLSEGSFAILRRGGAPFFAVCAQDLQSAIQRGFEEGYSVYD